MANGERKSSEELIREANSRLRAPEADPAPASPGSSDASGETTISRSPSIEYRPRPQAHDAVEEASPGPVEHLPPRSSQFPLGWGRWGLAALIFGGWFLFTTIDDANRDGSGEIVGGGDLDVMTLQVGDCFNDSDDMEDVVFDVAAVPCSEPHDNEVFAVRNLSTGLSSGEFPGDDALQTASYEYCSGTVFDDYVGTPYLDSALDVFTFTPTAESWEQGDRDFVCALYRLDLGKLTGTARGSGL